MKRRSAFSLCLLLFTLQGFAQRAYKTGAIRDLLRSANIPGIQLIYSRAGYTEAYNLGVVAPGSTEPVNSATIFEAASLSKAVFAYTVLRLVDQGVLALDTPLLHYIGGRYERFDPTSPAYGRITARMVLRHTTGFRNWADPGRIPLLFPPDSCFNYSGEGYMFLLAVLQKITHKDLQQLAMEETLKPLGMKNSSYQWQPAFASRSSFGSDSTAIADHSHLNAASSLLTDAQDYHIFLDALTSGKGLKPTTHRLMLSWQTPGNWFGHPAIAATAHIGWGLGVGIQYNEKGKALWQWGDNGDFKAFYMVIPGSREQLVYFTHSPRGLYIAAAIVDLFLGKQTTWAIPWVRNGYANPYEIAYAAPDAIAAFRAQLLKQGFINAVAIWKREKQQHPGFSILDGDLRTLAAILSEGGDNRDAAEILKLDAALYPKKLNQSYLN